MVTARPPQRFHCLVVSVAVCLGALVIAIWHPGARGHTGQALEGWFLDLRFRVRGPVAVDEPVAIVVLDDEAITAFKAFPPTRSDIASTVQQIFAAGARVAALDMLLVDERPDDAELAAALSIGAAVLGIAEASEGAPIPTLLDTSGFALVNGFDTPEPLPALAPSLLLQEHARLGHVTIPHEVDGALRRIQPAISLKTLKGVRVIPALTIVALSTRGAQPRLTLAQHSTGGSLEGDWPDASLDLSGALPLNYYGPEGSIPTYSAAALKDVDLRDKIIFVGATATGFGDRHVTPFDSMLPGVEALATLAANLLAGETLRRDVVAWVIGSVCIIASALAGLAAGLLRNPWAALSGGLTVSGISLAILQMAFTVGWWLDATSVLLSLVLGLTTGRTVCFLDSRQRAKNLARFQSPRLVEALASQNNPLSGCVPQLAVVLFVDVDSFTARSEMLGPEKTAIFLRNFHSRVESTATPLGGTIMDFAGDGVLVVFGLPEPAKDDSMRALQFVDALFASAGEDDIALRAGGHAGQVQLSLLGGASHLTVSVTGDVVNTASRLQEIAKSHVCSIALSETLLAQHSAARDWAGQAGLKALYDQPLRGRSASETVWIGAPTLATETKELSPC